MEEKGLRVDREKIRPWSLSTGKAPTSPYLATRKKLTTS